MFITVILTICVLWSLFIGLCPTPMLVLICLGGAAFLLLFGHHSHGTTLQIDIYAQRSHLSSYNPGGKAAVSVILLVLCICSQHPLPPFLLFLTMSCVTVLIGGLHLHDYLALFSLPAVFLLLSGIALVWDVGVSEDTVFSIGWFVITEAGQRTARLVIARALGAVSCLYFLSLSTPMSELLSVLRKIHVPKIIIELAVLIYRYLFVLLSIYSNMNHAAASRLGYDGLRQSLKTTGEIYGNLLSSSLRRAGAYLDAMESRCYDGEICFLEERKPLCRMQILFSVVIVAVMAASVVLTAG